MSREEILKQIEDIEEREFFLQMKDRWSQEDYRLSDKHHEEIEMPYRLLLEDIRTIYLNPDFICIKLKFLILINYYRLFLEQN